MELPQKAKDSFGEIFKLLLKDREDLTDQVEKLKFDSHVGRFVREFEHIKSDMLSFICQCFISRGLNKESDVMVRYLLKEITVGSILQYLSPMYKFVNPVDEAGHKALEEFSKKIKSLNTNRNNLIHQYHLELGGTMKDSGRKVTGRLSFSAKPSPIGPTVKGVIYKTIALEKNIQYVEDVRHCLKQCSEKITGQEAISDLLHDFNQRPVPTMGKTINLPP